MPPDLPPDPQPDHEPDYRMSLALERTYLAHIRTGLALMAAGVGVAGAFPDGGAKTLRICLGLGLVLVAATTLAIARPRWRAIEQAMRTGAPLPPSRSVNSLSWLVLAAAVVAAVVVILL